MPTQPDGAILTGQCYCGKITVTTTYEPKAIAYCHCEDCRRWTSAPVTAFAAFSEGQLVFSPNEGQQISMSSGVKRTFCRDCGSPLTGRYDYLPGQVYIGISIFDQAAALQPEIHCHNSEKLPWLHIDDSLERVGSSGRSKISKSGFKSSEFSRTINSRHKKGL